MSDKVEAETGYWYDESDELMDQQPCGLPISGLRGFVETICVQRNARMVLSISDQKGATVRTMAAAFDLERMTEEFPGHKLHLGRDVRFETDISNGNNQKIFQDFGRVAIWAVPVQSKTTHERLGLQTISAALK